MSTSRQEQAEWQAAWRLRDRTASRQVMDMLLDHEFLSPEVMAGRMAATRRKTLQHAVRTVPRYAAWAEARGGAVGLQDWATIPILTTPEVQAAPAALRSRRPPKGQAAVSTTRTSGTSGRPTEVVHSRASATAFGWLKLRELRWFGWDPGQTLAVIRPSVELQDHPGAPLLEPGQVHRRPAWPLIGRVFHTGPALVMTNRTPMPMQQAFLAEVQPAYLLSQSAVLEHLALASGRPPTDTLQRALGISQTMTADMEQTVRAGLGCAVDMNYGLNEIGLVASRCPEGGRYHVHVEHAQVELLDDDGRPAAPGTLGRIVVSAMSNPAMPLLRYDTGDAARVVSGPCPCGRTLPSFGEVHGRYRRLAFLPDGVWTRWGAIQLAVHRLSAADRRTLEAYRAHHHRDGSWTLYLEGDAALEDRVVPAVRAAFAAVDPEQPVPPLRIERTAAGALTGARKRQNFVSDFFPRLGDDDDA